MESLQTYLSRAAKDGASDLFVVPGAPVSYKLEGLLVPMDDQRLTTLHSEQFITEIYTLAKRDMDEFRASGDDDFFAVFEVFFEVFGFVGVGYDRFDVCHVVYNSSDIFV